MSTTVGMQVSQLINSITQADIDYALFVRDTLFASWGAPSFNVGIPLNGVIGPSIRVVPQVTIKCFIPPFINGSAQVAPVDSIWGAYNPRTQKTEVYPAINDWNLGKRTAAQRSPFSNDLRVHLGQLVFHETIHSLDPRALHSQSFPPPVTPNDWLNYHMQPAEITAHAATIAWEMRVSGMTTIMSSTYARRIIARIRLTANRRVFYKQLLAELRLWQAHLATLNIPP